MISIPYTHESVRLTGRWDTRCPEVAVTTTTGAYIEFAFEGRMALAHFDIFGIAEPRLHLWIQIDDGDMIEAPIDSHLRVMAKNDGYHVCRIIYKGGTECDRRWYAPLTGRVSFMGVQVEKIAALPEDRRPVIEFVGDSITEGVLIDMDFHEGGTEPDYINQRDRRFQDDVCATYAWLTAEALDLRPIFMGYGAVGATRAGQGKVPAAAEAYPYNFDTSPISDVPVDYVMINHGTNDGKADPALLSEKYAELLDVIRVYRKNATLIVLTPFSGVHHEVLGAFVADYNRKNGTDVHFIDSTGWISPSPVHPLRDGHRGVAEHLIPLMREIMK